MTSTATAQRFDMPAVFGPSHVPDRTEIPDASALIVTFETTREAAARLLPRFFSVAERPIVTLSRMTYNAIDYLGGRPYRELVVSVRAVHGHGDRRMEAGFVPVLWVDQMGALVAGREFQGLAKLFGSMPEPRQTADGWSFDCYEYESRLLEGTLSNMKPLATEGLRKLNQAAGIVNSFGWKLIPGPDGTVDVDYPTLSVMSWTYREAWTGESRFTIDRPDFASAPYSTRVMASLAQLPVVKMGRSFAGKGSAVIDRTATRRLPA